MQSQTPRKITKAIFPVAGLGTRFLPVTRAVPKELLPLVDTPLIGHAMAEASAAGIDEFIFITGKRRPMLEAYCEGIEGATMHFAEQDEPLGLGHAVWCARDYIGRDEAVAVILPDDVIASPAGNTPAGNSMAGMPEMVAAWENTGGNMIAAVEVPREATSSYGIITPGKRDGALTRIEALVEKPDPAAAPSTLAVIGRYIIERGVMDELAEMRQGAGGEIQLTDALAARIGHAPCNAITISGERFDCGSKLGFLKANIALGLRRNDIADELRRWIQSLP